MKDQPPKPPTSLPHEERQQDNLRQDGLSQGRQSSSDFTLLGDVLPGLFPQMAKAGLPAPTDLPPAPQSRKQGRAEGSSQSQSNENAKEDQQSPAPPSKASRALAQAGMEITARPAQEEAAYLARELVQCTLPHRDPGDVPAWVRRNGNFALVLQPGFNAKTMQPYGLPYGELPRLLLLWIVTEAVKNQKHPDARRIKLGETLNEFLRDIGGDPGTGRGKRGDAKRVKEQMRRLFNCRISFQYSEGNEEQGREAFLNMEVAREARLWWDFKNPDQSSLFESELILSEAFFAAVVANPVPIDWRAVLALKKNLKQSAFALDVYTWATYRVFRLQETRQREVKIPLTSLREQFGSEYNRLDNFKAALGEALAHVQNVFPALDYTLEKNALVLRDGKGRAIPTKAERPVLAGHKAKATAQKLSPKTREWFQAEFPLHNVDEVFGAFDDWRQSKGIASADTDAHFKAFVLKNYFKREC